MLHSYVIMMIGLFFKLLYVLITVVFCNFVGKLWKCIVF